MDIKRLSWAYVLSSLPRNNMVPGAKKITELLLKHFYSAVNPAWKIQEGNL